MNVVLYIVLIYAGLVALNFSLVLIVIVSNKAATKECTKSDWLNIVLACLIPLVVPFMIINETILYKLKPYWCYFDKTDSPFLPEYQEKRRMHMARYRMPYKEFLKHKVKKIKYFGIFTIYQES